MRHFNNKPPIFFAMTFSWVTQDQAPSADSGNTTAICHASQSDTHRAKSGCPFLIKAVAFE